MKMVLTGTVHRLESLVCGDAVKAERIRRGSADAAEMQERIQAEGAPFTRVGVALNETSARAFGTDLTTIMIPLDDPLAGLSLGETVQITITVEEDPERF